MATLSLSLSQFPPKPSFSHLMPHLAYRALKFDNLQSTSHFVKLLIKHLDLSLSVKWLPVRNLTQKVLPLLRYAWRCDVPILPPTRLHTTFWDAHQSSS
jgi:hypothetical protein